MPIAKTKVYDGGSTRFNAWMNLYQSVLFKISKHDVILVPQ